MSVQHVVWDWNGTLFADHEAVVAAANDSLASYRLEPFTAESLRKVFYRPLDVCYAGILGRPLETGEWERIDHAFHDAYHLHMVNCRLTPGVVELLESLQRQGKTQSLLSMWIHDKLGEKVSEFGIKDFFTRVDGRQDQPDGGHKKRHLIRHLAVQNLDPANVLIIGDSVDDGNAAREVGARAVLYSGGGDALSALEATGFPVVSTLAAAVNIAISSQGF